MPSVCGGAGPVTRRRRTVRAVPRQLELVSYQVESAGLRSERGDFQVTEFTGNVRDPTARQAPSVMVGLRPPTKPGRAVVEVEFFRQSTTDQRFEALVDSRERYSGHFGTYTQEHVLCGGVDPAVGDEPEDGGALIGIAMAVLLKRPAQHQIIELRI